MNFEGFYGNERAKEYLSSAFARHSFPHALLIAGESGIGKRTLADIIAKALVCMDENAPCGKCEACRKAANGFHSDIIKLDAENLKEDAKKFGIEPKNDSIIAVIRAIKSNALLRPNDAERKVYIINNAGALSHDCQDALLKILEEPPYFTTFILLCYNLSDLLPTIVSRAAHISLSPLTDSDMLRVIEAKLPGISADEQNELIKTSGGICSFLVEDKNQAHTDFAVNIANALTSGDELNIYRAISALEKENRDTLMSVMDELTVIIRDACVISSNAASTLISRADSSVSEKISRTFSPKQCCDIIEQVSDAKNACVRNIGVPHITGNLICKFAHTAANAASKG